VRLVGKRETSGRELLRRGKITKRGDSREEESEGLDVAFHSPPKVERSASETPCKRKNARRVY